MDDCAAAFCGLCCLCCAASAQSWVTTSRWGPCSGNAGCCGSCCKGSLNDDDFDEQVRRDMAETTAANAGIVAQQPVANGDMNLVANKA